MSQITLKLTKNEQDEIRFCQEYSKNFHHRTPGANRMFLISKLANALELVILEGVSKALASASAHVKVVERDDPFAK